jgi:putative transposase
MRAEQARLTPYTAAPGPAPAENLIHAGGRIMERWVQTCQCELLNRTLIWNQSHLLHALREFEQFCNEHRPHQGIANARPLQPLPVPLVVPDQIASLDLRRRDRLGGVLHEYHHAA